VMTKQTKFTKAARGLSKLRLLGHHIHAPN
jgi:hypothetical protein